EGTTWGTTDTPVGRAYWFARKARLPQWRARPEDRAAWQQALQRRNAVPIIDPDLVGPDDLVFPFAGRAAMLLVARSNELDSLKTLPSAPAPTPAMTAFATVVNEIVGVPLAQLDSIARDADGGADIGPRLDQLGLTQDAFALLRRLA